MKIYIHINQILTLQRAALKDGRSLGPDDLSIINDGAIVFDDKKILWVGSSKDLPSIYLKSPATNLQGHVLTPELVDSHTHLVFGGDRAQEYFDRLNGVSYESIAKRGGGILFTTDQTNQSSLEELFNKACERIERIHSYGIGTIEIKSGYGLNFEKEFDLSQIIDRLKKKYAPKIKILNTFMAAHDVPKSFKDSTEYLDKVVIPLLEKLAPFKIIDAIDVFHEKNYFNDTDVKRLLIRAKELSIPGKLHADELNDNNGAQLAVELRARSADHLLKISDFGIKTIAASQTVATLLPGTAFFLGKPLAPARKILDAGAKVALASDYNPGSCHCDNLLLIASISAAQLKMNQAEIWAGITLNAAHALGLTNQGVIEKDYESRFSLFKAESLSHISYNWGQNLSVSLP